MHSEPNRHYNGFTVNLYDMCDCNFHVITATLHVILFDKSGSKIDLKSIIESEILLIIDSGFLDRFPTLVITLRFGAKYDHFLADMRNSFVCL